MFDVYVVEFDVCLFCDGVFYVMYDVMVDWIMNGFGWIFEMDVDEIDWLDVGSWFLVDFVGELVLCFDVFFDVCVGWIVIYVEIKEGDFVRVCDML